MGINLWELQMDVSLKDAANCTDGITWSSVNYLSKKKSEYLYDLSCC